MRSITRNNHLASITTIGPSGVGDALTIGWKLFLNASLLLMPLLMLFPIVAIGLVISSGAISGTSATLLLAVGIIAVIVTQTCWAGTYPEWPMNQLLVHRLRSVCRQRVGDSLSNDDADWIESARMVEWVPRENWMVSKLDTAADVMLIRVSDAGVRLEGDISRYNFPPASIIGAELESIRPTGCFHRLHYVVLTVRTDDGPREYPLAFRDHSFGKLRSARRERQAIELCDSIQAVAASSDWAYYDAGHLDSANDRVPEPVSLTKNPYAAPRTV